MRIEKPRNISINDFDEDIQDSINMLAEVINPALENLHSVTNNGIDFTNMSWGLVTNLIVKVLEDGTPDPNGGSQSVVTRFKNTAQKNPIGIQVVYATCLDDPSTFPTGTPFLSFNIAENGLINIINIKGLPSGKRFSLNLVLITN